MPETTLLGNIFAKFAGRLPEHAKRLIFVASFSTAVAPPRERHHCLDDNTLRSINELMHVCARDDAMKLPSYLHGVIWNGRAVPTLAELEADDVSSRESIIEKIQRQIPTWLRYEKIDTDIRVIVENRTSVFHAPVL